MTDRTVTETLQDAREVLATRGLVKKSFEDSKGRVCAMGALFAVTLGPERYEGRLFECSQSLLADVLGCDEPGSEYETIADFNDAPRTTKAQVLAAFDEAIKLATILGA